MKQLPKKYDHKEAEKRWQETWEASDVYHWKDDRAREQTFVIDTPPPTVSGVLHMGHIFSYTQADFIARYQRMAGKDVFYPMGFDDNGLPTERLVEKVKKVRGNAMERAEFVSLCKEVVQDAEEDFRQLFKSAALSVDWRQEYQTISDDVRTLSQASFLDLAAKNETYRDFRPTFWDWGDQTAIAQAEIENKELPGTMNEIEFELVERNEQEMRSADRSSPEHRPMGFSGEKTGGKKITIMTTRPELLGACVAVMYHPEDDNADKYKGKYAVTPLFGVKVPMIADKAVEREKGTGVVMCCTFGDETDKDWWREHELPLRALLTQHGKLDFGNALYTASFDGDVPSIEELQGLKPKQANAKTIELLKEAGKLVKQTEMVHTVKCAERSGIPIEIIPTYQWFVRVMDKKEALLAKGNQCNWHPEFMHIRLNQWIEGLKEDWCISRQRFFGVPIPVWYSRRAGEEGKIIYADASQLPVDPLVDTPVGYSKDEVTPDKDILDTWATSSISPQISAHAISGDSGRFKKLFPADIRPQAHEIIRTWAFYTIVKAHLHSDDIPWKNLMISGWCLASDKTKMSKSKGNVVTPVDLIKEKGTDSVRYWASTSRLGSDTAFSEDLLKIGKKLVNKLWNASNFAALNLGKLEGNPSTASEDIQKGVITETLDSWILSRLHQATVKATKEFERFEYCDARVAIEDFFWNDFCDNYLELVKARAYGNDTNYIKEGGQQADEPSASDLSAEALAKGEAALHREVSRPSGEQSNPSQQSALYTLHHCLDGILRLFAPFVPHVTEELYSHIFDNKFKASGSLHGRGNWPQASAYPYDENAEKLGMAAVDILNLIRKAKSEASVSIKYPVERLELQCQDNLFSAEQLKTIWSDVKAAGSVETVSVSNAADGLQEKSEKGWFTAKVKLKPEEAKTA